MRTSRCPSPHEELSEELGGPLPPGLAALSDADVTHLLTSVHAAKARQREALREAIDSGLSMVPALLRRAVRKALFP